jgi:hypothetical protein
MTCTRCKWEWKLLRAHIVFPEHLESDGEKYTLVSCPKCGMIMSLKDKERIADGRK